MQPPCTKAASSRNQKSISVSCIARTKRLHCNIITAGQHASRQYYSASYATRAHSLKSTAAVLLACTTKMTRCENGGRCNRALHKSSKQLQGILQQQCQTACIKLGGQWSTQHTMCSKSGQRNQLFLSLSRPHAPVLLPIACDSHSTDV